MFAACRISNKDTRNYCYRLLTEALLETGTSILTILEHPIRLKYWVFLLYTVKQRILYKDSTDFMQVSRLVAESSSTDSSIDSTLLKASARILSFETFDERFSISGKVTDTFIPWDEVSDESLVDAILKLSAIPTANLYLLRENSLLVAGSLYGFTRFEDSFEIDIDYLQGGTFPLRWSSIGSSIFLFTLLKHGNCDTT